MNEHQSVYNFSIYQVEPSMMTDTMTADHVRYFMVVLVNKLTWERYDVDHSQIVRNTQHATVKQTESTQSKWEMRLWVLGVDLMEGHSLFHINEVIYI